MVRNFSAFQVVFAKVYEYNRYDGSVDKMTRNQEIRRSKPGKVKAKRRARIIHFFDYNLLTVLISLICFGLVMLYSTSAYSALVTQGDSMYYFKRQIVFYGMGLDRKSVV